MSTITLHECTRLHARITLAACEANRAKSGEMDAKSEYSGPGMRPWACNTCTDWQAWDSKNTVEVTVTNLEPETPAPICTECGGETRPFTRGLCRKCYQKQNRKEKKKKLDAQSVAVDVPVAVEQSALKAETLQASSSQRRIYLACPYTHTSADIMAQRLATASSAASVLLRQGCNVFSPLSHSAEIGKDLPPDFGFWGTSCLSFVEHWATDMYVLTLPGWEESTGVTAEVEAAKAQGIPVTHVLPLAM